MDPQVAVVIPTLGRHPLVRDVLEDLSKQTLPPQEVVVVDQTPSTKQSTPPYDDLRSVLPLKTIFLAEKGTCVSRNEGIASTVAPLVLLLDDDLRFDEHLIERHVRVLRETGADAIHGGVAGPHGRLNDEPFYSPGWDPAWALMSSPNSVFRRMCIGVASGNLLIRREWLDRVGGFDEWFNDGNGDDFDLGLRLFKAGAITIYDPQPVVTHLKATTGGRRLRNNVPSRVTSVFRADPPPTTPYFYMKHFPGQGPRSLFLLYLLKIFTLRNLMRPWVLLVRPTRLMRSWIRARTMLESGSRERRWQKISPP